MNIENILRLADLIEGQEHTDYFAENGFNMGCVNHKCGTPSCIEGFAYCLAKEELGIDALRPDLVREWLGINCGITGILLAITVTFSEIWISVWMTLPPGWLP